MLVFVKVTGGHCISLEGSDGVYVANLRRMTDTDVPPIHEFKYVNTLGKKAMQIVRDLASYHNVKLARPGTIAIK